MGKREIDIPDHIDTYLLDREIEASDTTALEAVMKVDDEKIRLEKEAEQLLAVSQDDPEAQLRLEDVYERCASMWHTTIPLICKRERERILQDWLHCKMIIMISIVQCLQEDATLHLTSRDLKVISSMFAMVSGWTI